MSIVVPSQVAVARPPCTPQTTMYTTDSPSDSRFGFNDLVSSAAGNPTKYAYGDAVSVLAGDTLVG